MSSQNSSAVEGKGCLLGGRRVSVIVPTFNGAARIGNCLAALRDQSQGSNVEILVVDDGSTDHTAQVVRQYAVRLISQVNAGPAAARNRGASEAAGEIILFTDDDCVPDGNWLNAMLRPFEDEEIAGVKGTYRTGQPSLIARFVQLEYEDRYRRMRKFHFIDFVDTYSAAFRRDRFLEISGYDTSFPVACAEDIDLSYRMSTRGWKMKFAPEAVVEHTHPATLSGYLAKKYKFAFWRVLAVRKNPGKGIKDSHTPQIMKLQLLFWPALLMSLAVDFAWRSPFTITGAVLGAFLITTLPFMVHAFARDVTVALLSPALLAARSGAQFLGLMAGLAHASRKLEHVATGSPVQN